MMEYCPKCQDMVGSRTESTEMFNLTFCLNCNTLLFSTKKE